MRKLLLAVAAVTAVAVPTTVAIAGGDDASPPRAATASPASGADATTRTALAHKLRTRAGGRAHHAVVLRGLADRLGVSLDELRIAARGVALAQLDRFAADGTIARADAAALRPCINREADCDRGDARRAARRVHRTVDVEQLDLVAIKRALAADAAEALGTTPQRVLDAVRAELVAKLALGRAVGFVSPKAQQLAIGCFDRPASCDVEALHRAMPKRAHRHR